MSEFLITINQFARNPDIYINCKPKGTLILFCKNDIPNKQILLLGHFIVDKDYIKEFCENLLKYPDTDFIYSEENNCQDFLKRINSKPFLDNHFVLRTYQSL